MELHDMADNTLPTSDVQAFLEGLKTLAPIALKLSKIDKSKLDESKEKFLVIRAVRLEHLIREVSKGESLRK